VVKLLRSEDLGRKVGVKDFAYKDMSKAGYGKVKAVFDDLLRSIYLEAEGKRYPFDNLPPP
jgi:hypothetical protein